MIMSHLKSSKAAKGCIITNDNKEIDGILYTH